VSLLPQTTLSYFEEYRGQLEEYEQAAVEARRYVEQSLRGYAHGFHVVEARAKHAYSLLDKLRRKEYNNPAAEVKDLIGVRVVTHYPDDAESAASVLRPLFEVDEAESYDRLDHLDSNEFDYRAIHLVVRLRDPDAAVTKHLKSQWFEIQVRSLLQHAWAAIEHEIKYKSGVEYPAPLVRRLAAIAGSLETLDQAFIGMRNARYELVDSYRSAYERGDGEDVTLDSARLIAFLECLRPDGASLREMGSILPESAVPVERLIHDALAAVGLQTARQLRKAVGSGPVKRALKKHAAAIGETVETLSHLILCLTVVWAENPDVLVKQYPELLFDTRLADTLDFDAVDF
jgi:ppGpp synthetase/RelA/SpoT-type nucleotidyltranferase